MVKKNPLYKGYSPDIIGRNIAEALKKGVPHAQAIGIALTTARREYRKRYPTGPFPQQLKFIGKVRGKNPAHRKKGTAMSRVGKKKAKKIDRDFEIAVMGEEFVRENEKYRRSRLGKVRGKNPVDLFNSPPVPPGMYGDDSPERYAVWEIGKKYGLIAFVPTIKMAQRLAKKMSKATGARYRIIDNLSRMKKRGKNPVSTLIKVFKHGPGEKKFQKIGYFTGTGWDTSVTKAEKYSAGKARELASQLKIPVGWGLALVTG